MFCPYAVLKNLQSKIEKAGGQIETPGTLKVGYLLTIISIIHARDQNSASKISKYIKIQYFY